MKEDVLMTAAQARELMTEVAKKKVEEQIKDIKISIREAIYKNKDFIAIEPYFMSKETEKALTDLGYFIYYKNNPLENVNFSRKDKQYKIISWGEKDEKNYSYRNE